MNSGQQQTKIQVQKEKCEIKVVAHPKRKAPVISIGIGSSSLNSHSGKPDKKRIIKAPTSSIRKPNKFQLNANSKSSNFKSCTDRDHYLTLCRTMPNIKNIKWAANYEKLIAYGLEKGCSVNDYPSKMKKQYQTRSIHGGHEAEEGKTYGKVFATWCENQRKAGRNNRLKKERFDKLNGIGVDLGRVNNMSKSERWMAKFQKLKAYGQEPGCSVNDKGTKMKKQLQTISIEGHEMQEGKVYGQIFASWCHTQRLAYRSQQIIDAGGNPPNRCRISRERINKLEALGFEWGEINQMSLTDKWMAKFEKLKAYGQEEGCSVNDRRAKMMNQDQTKSIEGGYQAEEGKQYGQTFAEWCKKLRTAYKSQKIVNMGGTPTNHRRISEERVLKLESIGFTW